MEQPHLDIVIVTWNSRAEIVDCLGALDPLPAEWRITVVDNASTDDTVELVRKNFPSVNVIVNDENIGFAKANNQVIDTTASPFVLALNPDTIASPAGIQAALDKMKQMPTVGMLGVQMLNADGVIEPSCQRFPALSNAFLMTFGLHMLLPARTRADILLADHWAHDKERNVDSVVGAFMLVRREAIEAAGSIPGEYFLYCEEVDWSYQMRKHSYKTRFTPDISIIHHGNRSGAQRSADWRTSYLYESKYIFCKKNYGYTKMRLIQMLDLVGFTLRGWYSSLFGKTDEREFAALNQNVIRRLIKTT